MMHTENLTAKRKFLFNWLLTFWHFILDNTK